MGVLALMPLALSITICLRPTKVTVPAQWRQLRARVVRATLLYPVPTNGASALMRGTACALHVLTHQRTVGVVVLEERINEVGTGHLFGQTPSCDFFGRYEVRVTKAPRDDVSTSERAVVVERVLACAMVCLSSSCAVTYTTSSLTLPFTTYPTIGCLDETESFTWGKLAREVMSPMLAPSASRSGRCDVNGCGGRHDGRSEARTFAR